MLNTSKATLHSIERAKERIGLNEKKAHRKINLALERGKDSTKFSSYEKKYLERISKNDCKAIAYDNFCYIVNHEGFCVTIIPLPDWFEKKKNFDGKTTIKNQKKYVNYYERYSDDFTYAV